MAESTESHSRDLILLEEFCRFLESAGYIDSDWYAEEPTAIDRFILWKLKGKTQ